MLTALLATDILLLNRQRSFQDQQDRRLLLLYDYSYVFLNSLYFLISISRKNFIQNFAPEVILSITHCHAKTKDKVIDTVSLHVEVSIRWSYVERGMSFAC